MSLLILAQLVLLFLVPFFVLQHTEAVNIQYLNVQKGGFASVTSDSPVPVRAFMHKPLDIVLGKHEFKHVECRNAKQEIIISKTSVKYENEFSTISVSDVFVNMSTKWNCKFTKASETFIITFKFHVIAAEYPNVTIGDKELELAVTNSTDQSTSKPYYDGYAYYLYKDGEYINLTCRYSNRDIDLYYYDSQDNLYETYKKGTLVKRLSLQNDGDWINCVIKSNENENYIYNIILKNQSEAINLPSELSVGFFLLVPFFVLIAVVFYLFWRKRKSNTAKNEDHADLVSDPNLSEPTYSNVRGALSEECINELYAIPLKKSARRNMHSDYAEPIELNMFDNPYSVPSEIRK